MMTPGPWKKWRLSPDSDPEQRCIITTEDGETEVCGIVPNETDAEVLAAAWDMHATLQTLLEAANGACDPEAGEVRDQIVNYIQTQVWDLLDRLPKFQKN